MNNSFFSYIFVSIKEIYDGNNINFQSDNMKKIIFTLLLLTSLSCFAQEGGWVTDKTSGCKCYTYKNIDKRYIKWNGSCLDGYIDGYGKCEMFDSDTLIYTYVGNFARI